MPDFLYGLASVAIGFAVAGGLASGYQLLTARRLSFGLLVGPRKLAALAAIPLLVFAAPFLILRNTMRGSAESDEGRFSLLAVATSIAGCWSLMSGTVVAAGWLKVVALLA